MSDIEVKDFLKDLQVSYFFSRGGNSPYVCIFSEDENYFEKNNYLIYDIPELLRLLVIKKELLGDEQVNHYYRNNENSLCIVFEWTELVRKVVRLKAPQNVNIYEQLEEINYHKETILDHFKKIFFKYMDGHEML